MGKKFRVDEKTIEETRDCGKDFLCLRETHQPVCSVVNCLNKEVHFITNIKTEPCRYRVSFGFSFICSCPTRKEIYNRYRS